MIILDWIRNILMNNKLNTTIYTKSIVKKFGEKEQFEVANALFEMGMDYDVIKVISGVDSKELFLHKINKMEFSKKRKK